MRELVVEGLRKAYEGRAVLEEASLRLEGGESLSVMGPSGSGKTTLLNLLGGLDRPDCGSIRLDGRDIVRLSEPELRSYRAQSVGFVFQEHLLLPELTGLQNALLPALGRVGPSEIARARELADRLGVAHRLDAYPWQMSGGERQRFALARALLNRPALLLCDEPTGNLDSHTGDSVVSAILSAAVEQGAMVVLATHNAAHAAKCRRVCTLRDGRLVADS
ncbi:MAG: ABC transporter ATP-binding protein [Armatimonadetes bacterium]|nr:ABC transporter ATP-binding protein [Armatimonadota bacterium]MCA1997905.1 ABC transporter ATP-binding protein [Armatimonadota bacterium]